MFAKRFLKFLITFIIVMLLGFLTLQLVTTETGGLVESAQEQAENSGAPEIVQEDVVREYVPIAPPEDANIVVNQALLPVSQFIASSSRSPEHVKRDKYINPTETMDFFGLKPDMRLLEILPGKGYFTEFLVPFIGQAGEYYASHYEIVEGDEGYRTKSRVYFDELLMTGGIPFSESVKTNTFSLDKPGSFVEGEHFQFILTSRNLHGFENSGKLDTFFEKAHASLVTFGYVGVIQHRAKPNESDLADKGYLTEQRVIESAARAGLELVARSEINANPKDTKDYDKGVWALPPTLANGDVDKDKYLSIGESDRMTLLFQKN